MKIQLKGKFGWIIFLWAAVSILSPLYFILGGDAIWLGILIWGQFIFIVGSIAVVSVISSQIFAPRLLLGPVLGAIMLFTGLYMHFENASINDTLKKFCPYYATILFFLVGAFNILSYFVRTKRERTCTECVSATCVYLSTHESRKDGRTHITYSPVFKFNYNGEDYTVSNSFHSSKRDITAVVGNQYDMYINPDNPKIFKEAGESKRLTKLEMTFGFIFLAISILVFLIIIFL